MQCGADVLVAGSFVFRSVDPQNTISGLKNVTYEELSNKNA